MVHLLTDEADAQLFGPCIATAFAALGSTGPSRAKRSRRSVTLTYRSPWRRRPPGRVVRHGARHRPYLPATPRHSPLEALRKICAPPDRKPRTGPRISRANLPVVSVPGESSSKSTPTRQIEPPSTRWMRAGSAGHRTQSSSRGPASSSHGMAIVVGGPRSSASWSAEPGPAQACLRWRPSPASLE